MTNERINEIVKSLWGKRFRAVEKPKMGEGWYELQHTLGINGAVGEAKGVFEVKDEKLIIRFVWANQADGFAAKAAGLGFKVEQCTEPVKGDTEWEWSVVKVS